LFSGGTDSVYAATLLAKVYDRIRLVTYDRIGFHNVENSAYRARMLKLRYGNEVFSHEIINIDKEFKKLSSKHHFSDFFKYGFYVLLNCGVCKLTMAWRTVIYCLDNGIKYVSDGSGQEMLSDPSQNVLIVKEMRELYQEYGIQYFTPVFDSPCEEREQALFDMGLNPKLRIKWTGDSWNLQPRCSQEEIHSLFFNYANKVNIAMKIHDPIDINSPVYKHYESRMLGFHEGKRNEIRKYIGEYLKQKQKTQGAGHEKQNDAEKTV
jgi:hypothetical protein